MKPMIFCLTPVKNEEWIIDKFLKASSIWADKIILSDQGSTDRTIEIAKKYDKVIILHNNELLDFNEQKMRAPLFAEARKYPGKKILISLDADELFTPNFNSLEWQTIINAEVGTRFLGTWYNISPDFSKVYINPAIEEHEFAFVDDGTEYNVGLIHVPRQPTNESAPRIKLNDIHILHFQFTNWERMLRKHIWYQMYEHINYPKKSIVQIYRTYHYGDRYNIMPNCKSITFDKEWINAYYKLGIDITSVNYLPTYIWDNKIKEYIDTYSLKYFKLIDIGDKNLFSSLNLKELKSNIFTKTIMNYLKRTQSIKNNIMIRGIDKILKLFI